MTSQISFRFTLAEVTPGLRPAWASARRSSGAPRPLLAQVAHRFLTPAGVPPLFVPIHLTRAAAPGAAAVAVGRPRRADQRS